MKFTWFHLMPYRFLPEDFKEKYRSVWVDARLVRSESRASAL